MADRILILGASARAAAASARRAGLVPFAVDLFADADTELICEQVWRCPPDRYPGGLFELAKQAPPMPWVYTGGLENYPELVGELARERDLWGNGPEVLAEVRNPKRLAELITHPDLSGPPVVMPGEDAPASGTWVRKPLRGSAGKGVRIADAEDCRGILDPNAGYYLQAFWAGRSASVVFRDRRPIGFTRQLVGTDWLHAAPFAYAGNVSWVCSLKTFMPLVLSLRTTTGIWGVDLLVTDCSCPVLEVNPRYTASVEVIEHTTGQAAFGPTPGVRPRNSPVVGKGIYYAPCPVTFPASGPWDESLARAADVWHRPDFADLPHPGDRIEPGQPVLTILTEAATEDECLARLRSRAAELDRLFGVPVGAGGPTG